MHVALQIRYMEMLGGQDMARTPLRLIANVHYRNAARAPALVQLRNGHPLKRARRVPSALPGFHATIQIAARLLIADADELGHRLAPASLLWDEHRQRRIEWQ